MVCVKPTSLSSILSTTVLLLLAAAVSMAAPVDSDGALRTAAAWRGRSARPLDRRAGAPTGRTRTFSEGGTDLFHLVELSGGGFVAVAADDSRASVMAFSPSGELPEEDDGGPLWTLLAGDSATAAGSATPRRRRGRGVPRARLEATERVAPPPASAGTGTVRRQTASGVASVSDVRVAPLVETKWNQLRVGSKYVYNYYTPNHWYCGCVATAMAQLMRYHRFPTASVAAQTFTCYTNAGSIALSMVGGTYDWASMPAVPTSSISDAQREAIGRLCYDAGVSVRMQYTNGGSGAFGCFAHDPLATVFGYANAESYFPADATAPTASELQNSILANLDAACPVMLAITAPGSSGQDAGHMILADGYGYEGGTLWCHLNMGWSGSSDLWYAVPDMDTGTYAFSTVDAVVYNVFPTKTGQLVTGRVTDTDGKPLGGATVTSSYTSGWPANTVYTVQSETNASGLYAVLIPAPRRGSRPVTVSAAYRGTSSTGSAQTSISASSSPYNINWEEGRYSYASGGLVIGNSWGNNLVIELPPPKPTVLSIQ